MTEAGLLDQLSQMRNEARRLGSRVSEDAISCAVKGKTRDMQQWIEAAIAEMRRVEAIRPGGR